LRAAALTINHRVDRLRRQTAAIFHTPEIKAAQHQKSFLDSLFDTFAELWHGAFG
jgi:hypothetical protein